MSDFAYISMTEDDKREEWMGAGIFLSQIRFKVYIEKRRDSVSGYRLKRYIKWHSLFTPENLVQEQLVARFLGTYGIKLTSHYYDEESIKKFMYILSIHSPIPADGVTDREGLHMMRWVLDNPIPHGEDFDAVLSWSEAFLDEEMMVHE